MSNKRLTARELDDIRRKGRRVIRRLRGTMPFPEVPGVSADAVAISFIDPILLQACKTLWDTPGYSRVMQPIHTLTFNPPQFVPDYGDNDPNLEVPCVRRIRFALSEGLEFIALPPSIAPTLRAASPHFDTTMAWLRQAEGVDRRMGQLLRTYEVVLDNCNTPGQLKRALPDIACLLTSSMEDHVLKSVKASPLPKELRLLEDELAEVNRVLVSNMLLTREFKDITWVI